MTLESIIFVIAQCRQKAIH